jgi:hypothetical protein
MGKIGPRPGFTHHSTPFGKDGVVIARRFLGAGAADAGDYVLSVFEVITASIK